LSDPSIPHIPWEQLEIKEKIGAGAAAIVSRGYWTVDGTATEVALKQLYLSAQQLSPDMLKDFLVEIKLTSALHHANVVRLIGISCSPELDLYLVAELMHRGSIRDVLDQKKDNLRWDIRLKLLLDAAKGMSYLHSRSVIHRDLKPRNLLVSKNWVCKVADFGASTISATSKTMTFIGTPAYMAPEVLAHTKYSEKADVFAFGVILVEVYTGNPPYTGEEFDSIRNQAQLIYQITKKNLRPSTDELPPALAHLIHDCWSEDPELRPSFSEIIVRLRRLRSLQLPSYSRVRLRSRRESGEFSSDMDFPGDLDAIRLHDLSHGKQSRLDLDPVAIDDMILEPNSGPSIEEQELEREARANLNSLTRSEQRLYSDPTARTFDNRRAQKLSLPL
jgi:serine/threonine protein kinase